MSEKAAIARRRAWALWSYHRASPEALNAARNGDTAGFVRGLKQRRYFTGNEAAYTRNVSRLANLAMNNGFNAVG